MGTLRPGALCLVHDQLFSSISNFYRPIGTDSVFLNTVGIAILQPMMLILPLTMMISILRYRLWDIDVVINRTLVYGTLSAVLLLLFLASVTLLQALFIRVTGQDSQAAIVLSTLLITVLFNPLRDRLQREIDRRFYRRRYNAQRAGTFRTCRPQRGRPGLT